MASKMDVASEKGLMAFNGYMSSRSYVEGFMYSTADSETFAKMSGCPDKSKAPHSYRWFVHVAAIQGVRGLSFASASPAAAAAPAAKKEDKKAAAPAAAKAAAAPAAAPAAKAAAADDDEMDDMFADDDEDEEKVEVYVEPAKPGETESRAQMLARLKKEAEDRTAKKEAAQRTLVAIEVKPWSTEQDLLELWKRITTTCVQTGVKWGETPHLVEVAFGIKKICTQFIMGATNSSDDIVEMIQAMEDDVQSVEVISMNVL